MSFRIAERLTGHSGRNAVNPAGREGVMAQNSLYSELVTAAPAMAKTYNDLAAEGPLDARTRRLVRLAVAAALASEGGVRHHVARAMHEGLPADELRHTVALALTMASQSGIRLLTWTEEAIACNGKGPKVGIGIRFRLGHSGDPESLQLKAELERFESIFVKPKISV